MSAWPVSACNISRQHYFLAKQAGQSTCWPRPRSRGVIAVSLLCDAPMQTYSPNRRSCKIHLQRCIPLAGRETSQLKIASPLTLISAADVMWVFFPPTQVTTAIIFNVEVLNEALRRALTARQTAWSCVTPPAPEHALGPQNQDFFFFPLTQYISHSQYSDGSPSAVEWKVVESLCHGAKTTLYTVDYKE